LSDLAVTAAVLLATSLACGCGAGSGSKPDGGNGTGTGGAPRGSGGAPAGSGGAGTGTGGAPAGSGGATAAGTGGAAGLGGAAGSGGAGGCVAKLWSGYIQLTDGSLVYSFGTSAVILDDATGKPLTGVVSVQDDAYAGAGCAALGDGTVKCWLTETGKTAVGQLGNGSTAAASTTFRATPVLATGGAPLTNVRAMAHGEFAPGPCAMTNDGKVYCWGDLTWLTGNGTTLHTGWATPVTIDGTAPLTGVAEVALGNRQACVLRQGTAAKEVWCWGYNAAAELGQGHTTNLPYPTKVPGLATPAAIAIAAASAANSMAFIDATVCVREGGNVRCWGSNGDGAAGVRGSATTVPSPSTVADQNGVTLDGVTDLQPGFGSFSALRSDGSLWRWGNDSQAFATSYATGVIALGYGSDTRSGPLYLTSDGAYHQGLNTVPVICPPP